MLPARTPLYATSDGATTTTLYTTTVLPLLSAAPNRLHVALPGGADGWLNASDAAIMPAENPFPYVGPAVSVGIAMLYLDTPYLWGGVTVDGADCSGFVQVCWRMAGRNIPRDAGPQFEELPYLVGRGELQPGDLLFFGRDGAITHVALSLGGERFIHAKGSPESRVLINSFHPRDDDYSAKLAAIYMGARRVALTASALEGAG